MTRMQIANDWSRQRLEELRRCMRHQHLDGLVIPRWDAHQSEYVIERDELLAWATGFSGTWGLAIITAHTAAVFVDGRYTVQAKSEVDQTEFEIWHLYDEPPEDWLRTKLKKGAIVGFDPLVVPPSLYVSLREAVAKVEAHMCAVPHNPIHLAWVDRPEPPEASAFPFPPTLCGETSKSKRERLAAVLKELEVDILAESQSDNIAWLLNLRGRDIPENPFLQAFALIDNEGGVELFADEMKLRPRENFELGDVTIGQCDQFLPRLKERLVNEKTVLVDPRFGPSGIVLAAQSVGASVRVDANPLTQMKAVKNQVELDGIARACVSDALVLTDVFAWLEANAPVRFSAGDPITESEVEEYLQALRERNSEYVEPSFKPISASGANGAMCHYNAPAIGSSSLGGDDLYLLDTGGQYMSGTTDTTRTTVFGEPSEAEKLAYTLVLKGHIALATQRFPEGTRGYQLDAFARQFLWDHNLDYDHGTGHGVGQFLSVHEHPQRIGKEPVDVPLQAGMTMTIEPGHYRAGEYGIRIENLFEVKEDENGWLFFEPLMYFPIGLRLLNLTLLNQHELDWLNTYHRKAREKLCGKELSMLSKAWLTESTMSIGDTAARGDTTKTI